MAFGQPRRERDTTLRGSDPARGIRAKGQCGVEHDKYHQFQENAKNVYKQYKRVRNDKQLNLLNRGQLRECLSLLLCTKEETQNEIDARTTWNEDWKKSLGGGNQLKRTGHKGVLEHIENSERFILNKLHPLIGQCEELLGKPSSIAQPCDAASRQALANTLRNSRSQAMHDRADQMADQPWDVDGDSVSLSSQMSRTASYTPSYMDELASHYSGSMSLDNEPASYHSETASHHSAAESYYSTGESYHSEIDPYHDDPTTYDINPTSDQFLNPQIAHDTSQNRAFISQNGEQQYNALSRASGPLQNYSLNGYGSGGIIHGVFNDRFGRRDGAQGQDEMDAVLFSDV